jgi:hypothetical protein
MEQTVSKALLDLQERVDFRELANQVHQVRRAFQGLQVQTDKTGRTVKQAFQVQLGLLAFPDLLGERPDRQARRERQERRARTAQTERTG